MYNSFFGFSENPFNLTPDPRYLFMSPSHKDAIEHMLYGINERKGFIVITGGIGAGKTTLCRTLLNHLDRDTKSALIFNSFISELELLKSINQEFGIDMPKAETKKEYIDALNRFLIDIFAKGGNAVIIIDEAQNLSHGVLEQIRMLSNLETAKEKLIQIILMGQPELQGVLSSPALRQLNERVVVRYDLKPLDYKDIGGYMEHRMIVAGGHGTARFSKNAVRKIFSYSRGNPRRINNVCDRALLISYALGKHDVSGGIIKKSIGELSGGNNYDTGFRSLLNLRILYAFMFLILIGASAYGGWTFKDRFLAPALIDDEKPVSRIDNVQDLDTEIKDNISQLYTDGQKSLAILFSMFYSISETADHGPDGAYTDIVSYNIPAEYYIVFKKPFRVSSSNNKSAPEYLVIKDTNDKGATVLDAAGKEHAVDRDFIIENWGEVSWIYPLPRKTTTLVRGSSNREVFDMQKALSNMGYILKTTGLYDQLTVQEIMKFQKDFGLEVDGIAGPRTRALMYQMVM